MPEEAIPIDRRQATAALNEVASRLPADWAVMPIGGLGMMELLRDPSQRTKDVDVVPLVALKQGFKVPDHASTVAFARKLSARIEAPKDQTSVRALLELESGRVKVELVRGRNPRSGGYFVTRRILEACAVFAKREDRVLAPPPDVLAFLKAWAATDQDKLVEKEKDPRGYHRARAAGFRSDVQRIVRSYLDRGEAPPAGRVRSLLEECSVERRARVARVLTTAGWKL